MWFLIENDLYFTAIESLQLSQFLLQILIVIVNIIVAFMVAIIIMVA